MRRCALLFMLAATPASLGCSESTSSNSGSDEPDAGLPWECKEVPTLGVNILFVIDNSAAMGTEQQLLTDQVDALLRGLANLKGGFPTAHIGVVSTDMGSGTNVLACPGDGDAGILHSTPRVPGCVPPAGNPFIEIVNENGLLSGNIANVDTPTEDGLGCWGLTDVGGSRVPADGDVALDVCDVQAAFECIALLGQSGCGFEQPLEAARRALTCTPNSCTNPGFLRGGAALGVVFLGDEDDCSARRDEFFDEAPELGPVTSYRCFEFGVTCDQPIGRNGDQTLTGCRSKTVDDVDVVDELYLHPVQEYREFFARLWPQGRLVMAGITGPYASGDEIDTTLDGALQPWLQPACELGTEIAYPGVRLNELVRAFGEYGVVVQDVNSGSGICTDDLRPALSRIGDALGTATEPGCSPGCQRTCRRLATCAVDLCAEDCVASVPDGLEEALLASCLKTCDEDALGLLTEEQWLCLFEESCRAGFGDNICGAGTGYSCECL